MTATKIAINGRFLARRITGVDRYAREILAALDCMMVPGIASVVVPEKADIVEPLDLLNIEVRRYGRHSGHLWEQLDYGSLLRKEGLEGLSLCGSAPMYNPGIVCIHDMSVWANGQNFTTLFRMWYRMQFSVVTKRAKRLLTVSEFSRKEMERYCPSSKGKVSVIPNAWQHMERIDADADILRRSELEESGYYFAMSSLSPNKNLKWLAETALLNPRETIAVAGGMNSRVFGKQGIPETSNVKYLGYVSDGEAKALMEGCKGFLFPTYYEGFGIPPMEALSCGSPIAVSDSEVMHEVYGRGAHYVDPAVPCEDLDALFIHKVDDPSSILDRYNWRSSAAKLLRIFDGEDE